MVDMLQYVWTGAIGRSSRRGGGPDIVNEMAIWVNDTHVAGVHPEGEVLHPRRLKSALVIVGCLALVLMVPITEPSLANIAGGAFFVCLSVPIFVALRPGASFVSIMPSLLRVRFLYRDTYFPLGFGSFSSHTDHGRLFKTIIWKYDDSDRAAVGAEPDGSTRQMTVLPMPYIFGKTEYVVERLNAYRDIYGPPRGGLGVLLHKSEPPPGIAGIE